MTKMQNALTSQTMATLRVEVDADLIRRYGGPRRNPYADEAAARDSGFPGIRFVGNATIQPFGTSHGAPRRTGLVRARNPDVASSKPVTAGDCVEYTAVEAAPEREGVRGFNLCAAKARLGFVAKGFAEIPNS